MEYKKEVKKEPRLRFSEFEGTWNEKRLGNLCSTFKSGSGITSEQIYDNGKFPVYGGNGLRGYTETFTHDGYYVLIGRQGALCGNINRAFGKSYISEHAIALCANESSNTEWLAQKLIYLKLNRLSESSAQPGLAVNKLVRLKLIVPSLPEQQKIASFLSAVDTKIQQLTRKKELLEQYKKGVMQKLFSQKIRFKDENGKDYPDWEEKRFYDLLSEVLDFRGRTPLKIGMKWGGEILSLSANNVKDGYIDLDAECNLGSHELYEKWMGKVNLEKNDIVFTMEAPLGKALLVPDNNKYILSQRVVAFKTTSYINNHFLIQLIWSEQFQNKINKLSTGSTAKGINQKSLKKVNVKVPLLEEQQKIADFLSSIDRKINSVNAQIQQTQQFKKGLLQQMFV